MTAALELLTHLQGQGIKLWTEDGELRFSAPKGAMTANLRTALRQRREEIIDALKSERGPHAGPTPIPQVPEATDYALSNAQQRIWILAQMEGASTAYNVPLHLELEGDLQTSLLEQAFGQVIDRHESLRTTFAVVDGEPRQRACDPGAFRLAVEDLSHQDSPQELAAQLAVTESAGAFDLEKGPLYRARLLIIAPRHYVLLCTLHHIICDGVSIGVLFREMSAIYNALKQGAGASLPQRNIQYRDYAAWHRGLLESPATTAHHDYWLDKLTGPLPVLDLPTNAARPPIQTFHGGELAFSFGVGRSQGLRHLAREHKASLFMVLLAHVKVLLHRYSGAQDIIVGTPVAGRPHPDLQDQIGLYLNTLSIRTRPQSELSFTDYLADVRRVCLDAYEHQDYPFDRLVDDVIVTRDLSRSPVFDVMMILQNQDDAPPTFDGIHTRLLAEHTGTSKVDLTLCCKDVGDEIWANLEYNTDLYSEERVRRLAGHLTTLIDSTLADPNTTLGRLGYLTQAEETMLLQTWNATEVNYPREQTVTDLIDETCRRRQAYTAIIAEDRSLTYGELEKESNRWAQRLLKGGVCGGHRVGLCLNRSADMIVALLAILKAGAAYIPLDPHYPAARIRYILEDAGVRILLTTSDLASALGADEAQDIDTLLFDRERSSVELLPSNRPTLRAEPQHECYSIYTSGSTGQPKGVVISHRALVNFLWSMASEPGISEEDVLLAVTTISFDIATLELLLPLLKGAQVHIASQSAAADATILLKHLDSEGITIMQATPATWRMLLEAGWQGTPTLKLLCGGEALSGELAERLADKGRELWNLYGPTESTIWSTILKFEGRHEKQADACVSIGRPIANTQVYILDTTLQPVPIGVSGDLYIGGDGLADRYHNRPELTGERFIDHLFSDEPGQRLYHTGDIARYRDDGNIEFLGRSDHQVKIRGFRIEMGEVEAALIAHPAIREAIAVTDQEDDAGRLLAYLTGESIPTTQLRRWLQKQLPDYMIPSLFIPLVTFPLTPSGKVDRNALPDPDMDLAARTASYTEPRNDIETTIARVWSSVLGVERVGIHDDFFEMGGHSLTATRAIFQLQRDEGLSLQLTDLFRSPTIESLAIVARQLRASEARDKASSHAVSDDAAEIVAMTAEELAMVGE